MIALLFIACGGRPTVSPLATAVRNGDIASVDALLAQGADPNAPTGVNDWPPLMHAVHKHQYATAAALLMHGADPNRTAGQTALTMAAGYGDAKMVSLLLANRADPALRDGHGNSPLDASLTGTSDIDEPTVLRCQSETTRMLMRAAPDVKPSKQAAAFAHMKGC